MSQLGGAADGTTSPKSRFGSRSPVSRDGRTSDEGISRRDRRGNAAVLCRAVKNLTPLLAFGTVAAVVLSWCGWQLFSIAAPSPGFASVQPEAPLPAATVPVRFSSSPPGADAVTSLGWSCRTPCSMELMIDAPVTVTFTHEGFAPVTIPVQIRSSELDPEASVSVLLKRLDHEIETGGIRRSTKETRIVARLPKHTRMPDGNSPLAKAWKAFTSLFQGDSSRTLR